MHSSSTILPSAEVW